MKGDRGECGSDRGVLCDDRQATEVKEDGEDEDERLSAFYFGSCSCRSRRYKVTRKSQDSGLVRDKDAATRLRKG